MVRCTGEWSDRPRTGPRTGPTHRPRLLVLRCKGVNQFTLINQHIKGMVTDGNLEYRLANGASLCLVECFNRCVFDCDHSVSLVCVCVLYQVGQRLSTPTSADCQSALRVALGDPRVNGGLENGQCNDDLGGDDDDFHCVSLVCVACCMLSLYIPYRQLSRPTVSDSRI